MTTRRRAPRRRPGEPRAVRIVTFPGMQGLDLVGPFEVFAGASDLLASEFKASELGTSEFGTSDLRASRTNGARAYDVRAVSRPGGMVSTETGLAVGTSPLPAADEPLDTLLLVGGRGVHDACADDELIAWICDAAPRARRVATVCTGTFLAARAGLLDGKTVTTHWARADRLAREHPKVTVDPDPIFVRSGQLWTSAGVTAGIDLALAMVEEDHGVEIAQTVARWLVMFLRRPGGQSQFAPAVWTPRAERPSVRQVQDAIESNPSGDHRVAALARRAAMSPRHFTRVFTDEVGEAPGQYVERVRVEAARRELEETDDTVAAIARRCGFGTAETMRRSFVRRVGVPPDHYRRRFGHAA